MGSLRIPTATSDILFAGIIGAVCLGLLLLSHYLYRRLQRQQQDLHQAKAALLRAQAENESFDGAFCFVDADGGVSNWHGLEAIGLGDLADVAALRDWKDVFLADDVALLSEALAGHYEQPQDTNAENHAAAITRLRLQRAGDGPTFDVAATSVPGYPGRVKLWLQDAQQHQQHLRTLKARADDAETNAAQLGVILNALPVPIWRRQADLIIDWCNQAHRAITGAAEADGTFHEIEASSTPGQAKQLAMRASKEQIPLQETRYAVVDRHRRALDVQEIPSPDGQGLIGFATDNTDREELRTEIKRLSDAHADVLNDLNTAIAIFSADKRLAYHNSAYAHLWRLDEDWLANNPRHSEVIAAIRETGLLPEQVDHSQFRDRVLNLYTSVIEPQEELMYRPDNRILRQVTSAHPMGGLLLFYEDITDRMRLEESYNTQLATQRETLNNLHEAVAVFGSDGRHKLSNAGYARMWQLDPEFLRKNPHISDIALSANAFLTPYKNVDEFNNMVIAGVTQRKEASGTIDRVDGRVIDFAAVPLPNGDMLYTYIDVTDTVRMERALRERNEALETADRMKSEFVASVSYELRTPLNVIIGFTEMLVNEYFGQLNERQHGYGKDILDASHQLRDLIDTILDVAEIEAGQMELEITAIDLYPVLENVLLMNRQQAYRAKISIELACPQDIGLIEADERRLKQALFNLLSNAAKFRRSGGSVVLGAARRDDEMAIWATMRGVDSVERERVQIFTNDPGRTRLDQRPRSSAGLGLALAKRIVELHGGRIELSEEGAGETDREATIVCYLPLRQPLQPAAAAE